jgi:outer membrane protein assembly factor BamB
LLDGATGRELWRASLPGEAQIGLAVNHETDGKIAVAVFDNSRSLSFIKGDSGQIISQVKLDASLVGRPVVHRVTNEAGVLMALTNGTLEVRNLAGVSILAIRLDSVITTGPVVVRAPQNSLVMLGTEVGLVALSSTDLTPLWRVATEADAPRGTLASSDLDADGTEEVVMVTRRGRVVATNIATGKIKWFIDGATDAIMPAFADLNGDGSPDVLVPGGSAFALGISGKGGKLIWKADGTSSNRPASDPAPKDRMLVAGPFGVGGAPLLVGADQGGSSLRAVGLPAGGAK